MAEDNKETSPSALLSGIQEQGLTKPVIMSVIFHIVLIGIFSIGYIGLCMKYGTYKPKEAIAAEKEQQAQTELENKRKKMAETAAESDSAAKSSKVSDDSSSAEKKVPKVIKDTEEVIKENPKKPSSLDTFDDDL